MGISFVTTMLARRAQFHQARLVENLSASNAQLQSRLNGIAGVFQSGGSAGPGTGAGTALQHAYALVQANIIRESTMLAYIDNFWLLGIVILCLIPTVFLMKKSKPGGGIAVH